MVEFTFKAIQLEGNEFLSGEVHTRRRDRSDFACERDSDQAWGYVRGLLKEVGIWECSIYVFLDDFRETRRIEVTKGKGGTLLRFDRKD